MSAAIKPHSVDSAIDAAIRRMEEDEAIIRGLRKQNERLREELLNKQLEASIAIAEAKFEAAQVGKAHMRIAQLESEIAALNEAVNRAAQQVQGLVLLPEDVALLKERVDGLCARENV